MYATNSFIGNTPFIFVKAINCRQTFTPTSESIRISISGTSRFALTNLSLDRDNVDTLISRYEVNRGYRYGFNGMEGDSELKGQGNSYTTEFRQYDPRVGRFLSKDKFDYKFSYQSPYVFAGNMPLIARDIAGDSVWVTTTAHYEQVGDMKVQKITHTIHVTGKILDLSGVTVGGGGCSSPKNGLPALESAFENEINALTAKQGTGQVVIEFKFDVDFEVVSSMEDVKDADHLIVLVDNIEAKSDPNLGGGGDADGLTLLRNKIAYVENNGNIGRMASTMIHELGHNLGMPHVANGTGNYMSYDQNRTQFTFEQLTGIIGDVDAINKGRNWSKHFENDSNSLWHTSTNKEPYDMDVKKGEKTPRRIYQTE